MTPVELLAAFRSETADTEVPYLWSDPTIYRYIDLAQKQFCRDTYGIADARSFKLELPGDGTTEWFPTDPRILKIRKVIDSLTGREYPVVAVEKMLSHQIKFDNAKGPVKYLISGLEANVLRASPIPNVAATLLLHTFRLPETVTQYDEFEIDEQHHHALLYWVKFKAYDEQDTETYDPKAAEKFRARHDAYCAKALIEQSRAMHTAGTVAYGGI